MKVFNPILRDKISLLWESLNTQVEVTVTE